MKAYALYITFVLLGAVSVSLYSFSRTRSLLDGMMKDSYTFFLVGALFLAIGLVFALVVSARRVFHEHTTLDMMVFSISAALVAVTLGYVAVVPGIFTRPALVQEVIVPKVNAPVTPTGTDPKNLTYMIEGESVTLVNGVSEKESAPGSSVKQVTKYWGDELKRDVDNDGKEDVAFLLTQSTGGKSTYYYLAVALKQDVGYKGTNAILLGDRISPQVLTFDIPFQQIVVNFGERLLGDQAIDNPMQVVSMRFKVVNGKLSEGK